MIGKYVYYRNEDKIICYEFVLYLFGISIQLTDALKHNEWIQ